MEECKTAVIGMGSNLGDRSAYLERAVELMRLRVGEILHASSVMETPAWGFEAPAFLNQIVVLRTTLSPWELLDELQAIERELGRDQKSTIENGKPVYHNRTIDLDILDYDGLHHSDDRLTLPHPLIHQRDFVLEQLRELDIDL